MVETKSLRSEKGDAKNDNLLGEKLVLYHDGNMMSYIESRLKDLYTLRNDVEARLSKIAESKKDHPEKELSLEQEEATCKTILAAISCVEIELKTDGKKNLAKGRAGVELSGGAALIGYDILEIKACLSELEKIIDMGKPIPLSNSFSMKEFQNIVAIVKGHLPGDKYTLKQYEAKHETTDNKNGVVKSKAEVEESSSSGRANFLIDYVNMLLGDGTLRKVDLAKDLNVLRELSNGEITLQEAIEKVDLTNIDVCNELVNLVHIHSINMMSLVEFNSSVGDFESQIGKIATKETEIIEQIKQARAEAKAEAEGKKEKELR